LSAPTSGEVTAVSGDTITVKVTNPQTKKTSTKKVTVTSSTTYTKQQTTSSSALVVGQCAAVQGKADDSGTVSATSITVSAPDSDGSCASGFGGAGGPGGQGGPGGSGNDSSDGGSTNG